MIPAYNEQATISTVLREILAIDVASLDCEFEIVVCDDGSTDDTPFLVNGFQQDCPQVKLVSHPRNLGKGAAIRTALAHATGDYVLIQDADLEYDIEVYSDMILAVHTGADVVYASRFLCCSWPRGMRTANYLANRILTVASNVLFGLRITDEATALKLFRANVLRSLDLSCSGFEFCPEVTSKLGLARVPIVEVPVNYRARNIVDGKKVRWTDGLLAMRVLLQNRFSVTKSFSQGASERVRYSQLSRKLRLSGSTSAGRTSR